MLTPDVVREIPTKARRGEIRHVRVSDVDLDHGLLYPGADERGRKSRAARRVVPIVEPLDAMIRQRLWQQWDTDDLLVSGSGRSTYNSGLLSFEALQERADATRAAAGLTRITAHSAATPSSHGSTSPRSGRASSRDSPGTR